MAESFPGRYEPQLTATFYLLVLAHITDLDCCGASAPAIDDYLQVRVVERLADDYAEGNGGIVDFVQEFVGDFESEWIDEEFDWSDELKSVIDAECSDPSWAEWGSRVALVEVVVEVVYDHAHHTVQLAAKDHRWIPPGAEEYEEYEG